MSSVDKHFRSLLRNLFRIVVTTIDYIKRVICAFEKLKVNCKSKCKIELKDFKMKVIILLVAIICGATAVDDLQNVAEVKVKVVDSIERFKKENPTLELLPMNLVRSPRLAQNIYTLGSRLSGDYLVASNFGSVQYPIKQNLELNIRYPANGIGAIVTSVQITINQDDYTNGRGYVINGGLGQRYIEVLIESWNTSILQYNYWIYGY